jgi:UMF1 family MFS transporter
VKAISADEPGEHTLGLLNSDAGGLMAVSQIEVLKPRRQNNLAAILGMVLAVQVVGIGFAALLGRPLFSRLADRMDTKRSIILALIVYAVIAVWAFFLNSTVEFWFLAFMVAIVQGGSQALSRSLYASMSPAAKSGEFFGLFGVMEKFSAILGPILFAAAGAIFGSSRPAILSLIAFFIVGILILNFVDTDEGRRVAQADDEVLLSGS